MTNYSQERDAFEQLKSCSLLAKKEYEKAFDELIKRYNTTIYENRFIAGGALEIFTYALLHSAGISCEICADCSVGGDIILSKEGKSLSIKGTFTGRPEEVKLINQLGRGKKKWKIATLFVISGIGIVYASPDMVDGEHIKYLQDGTSLKKIAILELIKDTSNVFAMELSPKSPKKDAGSSEKVSRIIALDILKTIQGQDVACELVLP